jgi:hypothetical protein
MSNTFYDIGQKFKMNHDVVTLVDVIPGVVGTVPNLYVFEYFNPGGTLWKVYEDDFCLLVVNGVWVPIACDIDALLERYFGMPNECHHQWKEYRGLIEQYTYCELCDKKRE